MIPAGVHEAKPGCPNAMAANECIVTPSTSLLGAIASKAARSSTCAGTGCCSRIPSTPDSCDSSETAAITALVVAVSGRWTRRNSIPAVRRRFCFIFT